MASIQLELPLPNVAAVPPRVGIPRPQRVFVNRNLRMAGIDWVGFDMDYTLAVYEQSAMDQLSLTLTVPRLLERGYPEYVADLTVHPAFAIRGLIVDKRLGHVLKLDRYRVVQKGYHGLKPIAREELRTQYQTRKIRFAGPRFHWADSLYSLGETALYASLVDLLEAHGVRPDYEKLFADVRECADSAHRDGTFAARILADLPRFVRRDPRLAQTLHNLRSAGKRLFLLTNSDWAYTRAMMTFLLGDAMPEYPSWRHYFDFVVVSASKPGFFTERRPFRELEEDGEADRPPASRPASHIERGRAYEGGNLVDLNRMVSTSADRVLYVGDHIYGDILRSKKEAAWRTVLILQELEAEIAAHDASVEDFRKLADLTVRLNQLEDELRATQLMYKDLTRQIEASGSVPNTPERASLEKSRNRVKRTVERIRGLMRAVHQETSSLEQEIDRRFHPYWGSLLKEGTELSGFGDQVQAYACVYTSQVSNLAHYSPLQLFRSPRDLMPHEL